MAELSDIRIKAVFDIDELLKGLDDMDTHIGKAGRGTEEFNKRLKSAFDKSIKTVGQLEAEIDALSDAIKHTDVTGMKKLNDQIGVLQRQLDNTKITGFESSLEKIEKQAGRTGQRLGTDLKGGSDRAGNALLNLGRVAQDAPFGFIGISNNINPLLESFQRLQKESGSTGSAIKALIAGLSSGAGLGLAVSVITGLMTVLTMHMGTTASKAKETGGEFKSLAEAVKVAADQQKKFVEDIGRASQALISQAKDIKDLRALLISTSGEYDTLTAATIKLGVAQYFFSQKTEAAKKLLDALIAQQVKIRKINNPFAAAGIREYSADLFGANKELKAIAEATEDLKNVNILSGGLDDFFKAIVDGKSKEKKEKVKKDIETIADVLADLDKQISFLNSRSIAFKTNEGKAKIEAYLGTVQKLMRDFDVAPGDQLITKLIGKADQQKLRIAIQDTIKTAVPVGGLEIVVPVKPDIKITNDSLAPFLKDITSDMQGIMETFAERLAGDIGTTLGKALAGAASAGDIFSGIFQQLGSSLSAIGDLFIQTGIEIAIFKKLVLKNPALAIAAGVALKALGAFVAAKTSKVPGFANGVKNFSGGLAVVGERGPELVQLPRGSDVIPNNQLSGISIGGGQHISVSGRFELQNNVLVAAVRRGERSLERQGA